MKKELNKKAIDKNTSLPGLILKIIRESMENKKTIDNIFHSR